MVHLHQKQLQEAPRPMTSTFCLAYNVFPRPALHSHSHAPIPILHSLISELKGLKASFPLPLPLSPSSSLVPQKLTTLLSAFTRSVTSLQERKHERLITEILDIPLWTSPASVRIATLDFIVHAVVANGALVQSCLHTLVYALLPPPAPPTPDPHPGQPWTPLPDHATTQDDVLNCLIKVLELVPTSSQRLLPLLSSNFPHKLRDRTTHCLYLRALFTLAEARAGGAVREAILALVIEHLISIDVEIRWEDIVDVMTEETKEEEGGGVAEEEPDIFELEGMTELEMVGGGGGGGNGGGEEDVMFVGGGFEGGHPVAIKKSAPSLGGGGGGGNGHAIDSSGGEATTETAITTTTIIAAVDETADKLDSLMEMTMEHVHTRVEKGQLPALWDTVMSCFDTTILHTHRSKFVQFLVFYLARHAPEPCCTSFVSLLLHKITDRLQPPITRSAAAAYCGSFLARAGYVPEPLVIEALNRLADWCLRYTREEDRKGGLPPIPSSSVLSMMTVAQDAKERHAAFFASFQSLLYALCYHMEPLLLKNARSSRGGSRVGAAVTTTTTAEVDVAKEEEKAMENANDNDNANAMLDACSQAIERMFRETMPRLLTHPLDPLSSCARSVVIEFGRQAGALGHPALLKIVKEWQRRQTPASSLRSNGNGSNGNGAHASSMHPRSSRPLEVFFPFDPYLLCRSASYLQLNETYVMWRKGHPSGAARAGLAAAGGSAEVKGRGKGRVRGQHRNAAIDDDDDGMWEGLEEALEVSSGLEDDSSGSEDGDDDDEMSSSSSSSDSDSSDSSSSDDDDDILLGSGHSDIDSSSTDSDTDGLRKSRFGSMPNSSLSSDGRRRISRRRVPGALRASLAAARLGGNLASGGSPTTGMPIPGHGSLSTDNGGSPWGMSPSGGSFYLGSGGGGGGGANGGAGGGGFAPMSMN